MAVWQVVIEKQLGTEYWVNDYHVNGVDLPDASSSAEQIIACERAVHTTQVSFTKYRIRPAGSTAQGTVYPIGLNGLAGAVTAWLPLYNTVRVDMAPVAGRVGRKYLRLPVDNQLNPGGQLPSSYTTAINNNYCTPLLAIGTVCKQTGEPFTTASVQPALQMRQLRRGSKRKLQPII